MYLGLCLSTSLGLGIGEHPTAEADDPPLHVEDGEHEPMAKPVVMARAALAGCDEPHLVGGHRRDPLLREKRGEPVPAGRGISNAKSLQGIAYESRSGGGSLDGVGESPRR